MTDTYWQEQGQRLPPTVKLEDLDEHQRAFCDSDARDIRVLAPAGSGKTQTLLWRCVELHKRDPQTRILLAVFTTAARVEVDRRVNSDNAFLSLKNCVEVRTLNSWGWRLIHGIFDHPTLVTRMHHKAKCVLDMRDNLRDYPLVERVLRSNRTHSAAAVLDHVDTLKNMGFQLRPAWKRDLFLAHWNHLVDLGMKPQLDRLIRDLRKLGILSDPAKQALLRRGPRPTGDPQPDPEPMEELFERLFGFGEALYYHMLRSERFTIEDQKYAALGYVQHRILGSSPPSRRYTHVLVDEFQDVSPLDVALIRAIMDWHDAGLTIVGDDDQAIFEWRGGTPRYLLDPKQEFGRQFTTYVLARNYRCRKNIVHAATKLIQNNKQRHDKHTEAVDNRKAGIVLLDSPDMEHSVDSVMDEIDHFMTQCSSKDRMALLARKRAQLVPYQILLASRSVHFEAADDLKIFLSHAFEQLIRLIRIRASRDEQGLPVGEILKDSIQLCRHVASSGHNQSVYRQAQRQLNTHRPSSFQEAHERLMEFEKSYNDIHNGRATSPSYADAMAALFDASTVAEAIDVLDQRFPELQQHFGKGTRDIFYRDPPFYYLRHFATRFGDNYAGFVRALSHAKKSASKMRGDDRSSSDGQAYEPIQLATALRAKGKEFHTVVILNANNGVWPSELADTLSEQEAERRLFYVAMTRTKERLVVSWSRRDTNGQPVSPSPYIREAGLRPPAEKRQENSQSGRGWPPAARTSGAGIRTSRNVAAELVDGGEGSTLEFKSTLRTNMKTGKKDRRISMAVLKTIAGFLNTKGGTLLIGVADDGSHVGIESDGFANEDQVIRHLHDLAGERLGLRETMDTVHASFFSNGDHRILGVKCDPSRRPIYLRDGNKRLFYVRIGAATKELHGPDLVAYVKEKFPMRRRGSWSWPRRDGSHDDGLPF